MEFLFIFWYNIVAIKTKYKNEVALVTLLQANKIVIVGKLPKIPH